MKQWATRFDAISVLFWLISRSTDKTFDLFLSPNFKRVNIQMSPVYVQQLYPHRREVEYLNTTCIFMRSKRFKF